MSDYSAKQGELRDKQQKRISLITPIFLLSCSAFVRTEYGERSRMGKKHLKAVIGFLVLVTFLAESVEATTTMSIADVNGGTLGGLTFGRGDLAEYNAGLDTATLYFDGSLFSAYENINAVHRLANENILLSTTNGATLGGLTFAKGDLVEYNSATDTATLYLDNALFSGSQPNIDAVYVNGSGNIILSTAGNATLGGLSFGSGDLAEYNPSTDTATLYFDGSLFAGGENIDAAHILSANGNIVLSTGDAATLGGLSFGAGDLVEYDSATDTATLYFDGSNFSGAANIDAAFVDTPEPATIMILGLGAVVLTKRRK